MERQLYRYPMSGVPGKEKKKYVEPVLSEVAFTAEKGFADSAVVPSTSIQATESNTDYSSSLWE